MNATIENNMLVVRIPMNAVPTPSASGKTLSVASSGGNKSTTVQVNGQPVIIGLNAYIKR
jgi:hypothetical protein